MCDDTVAISQPSTFTYWCPYQDIAEIAAELVAAIERDDPDWHTAYEWLRDALAEL